MPSDQPLHGTPASKIISRRAGFAMLTVFVIVGIVVLLSRTAFRRDPLEPARHAFDRGEYSVALRLAMSKLLQTPRDPSASLIAARCLTSMGSTARAEFHFANAGALGETDLHDRVVGLIQLDRLQDAASLLEQWLEQNPRDPLALQRLAALRLGQLRYKEAAALGDRLAQLPDQEIRGWTLAGSARYENHDYELAAKAFQKVIALDPHLERMPLPRVKFWSDLAISLMASGRSQEARAYLKQAFEREHAGSLMELIGLSHHQEGSFAEAERCWLEATRLDPSLADAWLNLGRLALARNEPSVALPRLLRASELSPDSIEPYYSLMQTYRSLGRDEEAVRYERRVAELRGSSSPRTSNTIRPAQ